MIQLEFFEQTTEQKLLMMEKKLDKMRKSQFALIAEVKRLTNENTHDLEILKANICKNKLDLWD